MARELLSRNVSGSDRSESDRSGYITMMKEDDTINMESIVRKKK